MKSETKEEPTCPLCRRPLAGAPTTTLVDTEPWRLRREPPVSVPVHRTCAAAVTPTVLVPAFGGAQ